MQRVSALYRGELSEAGPGRWRRRRAAMLLVDLHEAPGLARRLRRWGVRLSALAGIEAELARAGLAYGGPVRALCAKGVSAYLCYAPDGALTAVRYELASGRSWLVPTGGQDGMARLRGVSAGGETYTARVRRAGGTVQLAVDAVDVRGVVSLAAGFVGRRRRLPSLFAPRLCDSRMLVDGLVAALEAWRVAGTPERRLAA